MIVDGIDLAALERAVEHYRSARPADGTPENATYTALKQVCGRLRASTPQGIAGAFRSIDEQVERGRRRKARVGYVDVGHMQAIAEAALAHWPAVRRALHAAGEENGKVRAGD